MTLQQLEYALALEKYGSFTRAAKSLSISQPALSLQIRRLEEQIGIDIFDRSKIDTIPTNKGLKFLVQASELVHAGKQLADYAQQIKQEKVGSLKIGIIPTLSPYLVPLFSGDFLQENDQVKLEVNEMLTEQILHGIRTGELDGGIIATPIQRQGLLTKILFYESFFLYHIQQGKSLSTVSVSDLSLDKLWILEEGNCFRDQINDLCGRAQPSMKQLIYRCSSIDSLIRMVDNQGGSTILPELTTLSLTESQEQNLSLISNKVREVSFVTRKLTGKDFLFEILNESIVNSLPAPMKARKNREVVDPGIAKEWISIS